jgi:hypothetical protein
MRGVDPAATISLAQSTGIASSRLIVAQAVALVEINWSLP